MPKRLKSRSRSKGPSTGAALTFVVMLGVVSLLADMTYEGARSITGPFLAVLGASGAAVGVVSGLGELLGYGIRLAAGLLTDQTRKYWTFVFVGYAVNLGAVPLLALAGRWETAALLILMERVGKAIRAPARDAMLSHATQELGHGWGFGLHEALDQIGAVLGPLIVTLVLAVRGSYPMSFAVLAIPAVLALTVLLSIRLRYPRPETLEVGPAPLAPDKLPRAFWIYLAAVACVAAGFADFPLIAFHFQRVGAVPALWVPTLYALAMGVDALAALIFGRLFDRLGLRVLAGVALGAAGFAPLVFLGGSVGAVVGMVLWGAGLGAQESVLRAAVGGMVSAGRRATAYGVLNAGYGLAWFAGSALMGILYDTSIPALVGFSVVVQLLSVPIFWRLKGEGRRNG
jgi:predicted MFS family arabinose efflux permease